MGNEIEIFNDKTLTKFADEYINGNELILPESYDYRGAVNAFYLECLKLRTKEGKLALEACSKESIIKSLQDMLLKGLNPLKKQCYLITYAIKNKNTNEIIGYDLQLQTSYFGNQKQAKSSNKDLININGQCIYKGDVFEYKILLDGRKEIVKHEQKFENIKSENIMGAYAVATFKDGKSNADIMTIEEIKKSWAQSTSFDKSVHNAFTHEMALKTVKSRLTKHYINTSNDESLLNQEEEENENDIIINPNEINEEAEPITIIPSDPILSEEVEKLEEENDNEIQIETELQNEEKPQGSFAPKLTGLTCECCNKEITQKIFDYSLKNYSKALCYECQRKK